jgi:hypothetical protein
MTARENHEVRTGLAVLLLMAVPVLLFWRSGFFYMIDDWTTLIQMVDYPFWQYLSQPDCENWFPFFHLVYYGLVKIAGENYDFLVLVNCLVTGANAVLVLLFFRRHWSFALALTLSLVYAGAAVHHATIWNAYYLCYLLCLGFFLGALLLTDAYRRAPSRSKLAGIGLGALLSALSHNFLLVGLMALPLYALLAGEARKKSWQPLALVVGGVYLLFTLGYMIFAGSAAATTHNQSILSTLPGWGYVRHFLNGAYLAPFFYLFWGHFHFPVWAIVSGVILLIASLALIRWQGEKPDRRLALWALVANGLPFLLISLARHQKSIYQAFVARYAIFTLIGALLLVGTAWRLLAPRLTPGYLGKIVAAGLLAVFVSGQVFSLPIWRQEYLEISRAAVTAYRQLGGQKGLAPEVPPEVFQKFCPGLHPTLTQSQVVAVRRLLTGQAP